LVWVCFGQTLNFLNDPVYFFPRGSNRFLCYGLGNFP